MLLWKMGWVNFGILFRMFWAFQARIVRYFRELFITEGTYGFDDDDEFFHGGGACFILRTVSFIVVRIFLILKDLNR